jgi:hypothetical protein
MSTILKETSIFLVTMNEAVANKTDRHDNWNIVESGVNHHNPNSIKYTFNMTNPIRKLWNSYKYTQSYLKENIRVTFFLSVGMWYIGFDFIIFNC